MTVLIAEPKISRVEILHHCGTPLKSMARRAKYGFDNAPGVQVLRESAMLG